MMPTYYNTVINNSRFFEIFPFSRAADFPFLFNNVYYFLHLLVYFEYYAFMLRHFWRRTLIAR